MSAGQKISEVLSHKTSYVHLHENLHSHYCSIPQDTRVNTEEGQGRVTLQTPGMTHMNRLTCQIRSNNVHIPPPKMGSGPNKLFPHIFNKKSRIHSTKNIGRAEPSERRALSTTQIQYKRLCQKNRSSMTTNIYMGRAHARGRFGILPSMLQFHMSTPDIGLLVTFTRFVVASFWGYGVCAYSNMCNDPANMHKTQRTQKHGCRSKNNHNHTTHTSVRQSTTIHNNCTTYI